MEPDNRAARILGLYSSLIDGQLVNKTDEARKYSVNERTIQRDLDDIRSFLELSFVDTGVMNAVVYDHLNKGYRLERPKNSKLSTDEIITICKLLLNNRDFEKAVIIMLIEKLISCYAPEKNKKLIIELVDGEKYDM